jgi:hypothetical protein
MRSRIRLHRKCGRTQLRLGGMATVPTNVLALIGWLLPSGLLAAERHGVRHSVSHTAPPEFW